LPDLSTTPKDRQLIAGDSDTFMHYHSFGTLVSKPSPTTNAAQIYISLREQ
jgi:hypothetical protein